MVGVAPGRTRKFGGPVTRIWQALRLGLLGPGEMAHHLTSGVSREAADAIASHRRSHAESRLRENNSFFWSFLLLFLPVISS
jgi:hypothetical protein